MTEYEIYSYESFRKKYQDDIRSVPRASFDVIDGTLLGEYISKLKAEKQNLSAFPEKTIVDPSTGKREDRTEYPVTAVREAILNTLVHRDYSIHTEGMPIQIKMFSDRIEISNPGGLYGRLRLDQLGKKQPDTRNPVLENAMEILGLTENRYSGIPTIRKTMEKYGLDEPVFLDERGTFTVVLYNARQKEQDFKSRETDASLMDYLSAPRSKDEIAEFLGIKTVSYAMQTYVYPLIKSGLVRLTIPEKPRSHDQKYVRCNQKQ